MSEVVSLMSLVRSSGIISLTPCGAANATAAEANARRAYNNFMILLVGKSSRPSRCQIELQLVVSSSLHKREIRTSHLWSGLASRSSSFIEATSLSRFVVIEGQVFIPSRIARGPNIKREIR